MYGGTGPKRNDSFLSKTSHWISRCNCVYYKVVSTDYQHKIFNNEKTHQHNNVYVIVIKTSN